jgi:membrane associated rhomboid family serine protease
LDLNHIFLFIAVVSPLLVLMRAWRPGGELHGWRVAAVIVLAVTGAGWLLARNRAGYIGAGVWLVVLFVPAVGLRKVAELVQRGNYRSARRLASGLRIFHPTSELRRQIELLQLMESRQASANEERLFQTHGKAIDRGRHARHAPLVLFFIAANVFVFAIELMRQSTAADSTVLYRLGALDFYSVVFQHQYWRLLTALFLHYGFVHLVFNLFALYVLGPPLERAIGSIRFAVSYLVSGLGSTIGVIWLTLLHVVQPSELVGASGSIMGIVGAWAGFLLRHRHAPRARQRLLNILFIVVVQTAFDIYTPQVSLAAHTCGLITGFVVGILISPRLAI